MKTRTPSHPTCSEPLRLSGCGSSLSGSRCWETSLPSSPFRADRGRGGSRVQTLLPGGGRAGLCFRSSRRRRGSPGRRRGVTLALQDEASLFVPRATPLQGEPPCAVGAFGTRSRPPGAAGSKKAFHHVVPPRLETEVPLEPGLAEGYGQGGAVDADPGPGQPLGRRQGSAAPAEGV